MAPLGANQNEKPTNESGELVSETAPMEMHPAPLTPGNMFSRLAGIGLLLLVVVLSAARYPIVLFGSVHFSPILPHSVMVYALLRETHTILAYLFFLAFVAHFGAVLFHTLIVRDGLLGRMVPWRVRAR
jgi:cytochrome b561